MRFQRRKAEIILFPVLIIVVAQFMAFAQETPVEAGALKTVTSRIAEINDNTETIIITIDSIKYSLLVDSNTLITANNLKMDFGDLKTGDVIVAQYRKFANGIRKAERIDIKPYADQPVQADTTVEHAIQLADQSHETALLEAQAPVDTQTEDQSGVQKVIADLQVTEPSPTVSTGDQQTLFNRELKALGGYVSEPIDDWDEVFFISSFGFEHFKKYSSEYGDFLTHDVQMRFTWDFRKKAKDAWAVEIHNAWLDFKLGLGHTLRIGHFEPYFGLDVLEDSHGTLLQTLIVENAGSSHDWGVGYKTYLGSFDLRVGAQLGMGMSLYRYKKNYLYTTRIGLGESGNTVFALSGLFGSVYTTAMEETSGMEDDTDSVGSGERRFNGRSSELGASDPMEQGMKPALMFDEHIHSTFPVRNPGPIIRKWRAGYDFSNIGTYLTVKSEAAIGMDEKLWVVAALIQIEYPFPFERNLIAQVQVKFISQDLMYKEMSYMPVAAGFSYTVLKYLTFRAAYEPTIFPFAHKQIANHKARLMLYYYGT